MVDRVVWVKTYSQQDKRKKQEQPIPNGMTSIGNRQKIIQQENLTDEETKILEEMASKRVR